jgi:hypothetical protein
VFFSLIPPPVSDDTEQRIFVGDLISNHVQLSQPYADIVQYLNSLKILKHYANPNIAFSSTKGTCFTLECLDCLIALVSGVMQDSVPRVGEADGVLYSESGDVGLEIEWGVLERGRDSAGLDEITEALMAL